MMLKDLTKQDWLQVLTLPEERIPQALILRGTRDLKGNYTRHQALFSDVIEVGSPNLIIDDVFIGRYHGIDIGYGSVYGGAMATDVAHIFGVLGTPLVIQTGCCGALTPSINIGEIICATAATCSEGSAQHYLPGIGTVAASTDLVGLAMQQETMPISLHAGPLITTGALLAESEDDIRRWGQYGYLGVDMETAATFAVAEYFGMQRLSLLFVFDNPAQREHILLNDADKQHRRALANDMMLRLTLALISTLNAVSL